MKVNLQVIIQFCPQNTEGPLLLSPDLSNEARGTRAPCIMWAVKTHKKCWKQRSKHLSM